MKLTPNTNERNALLMEAQADELDAEAARLRAQAKRARAELDQAAVLRTSEPPRLTRSEYARREGISPASVSKLVRDGMPVIRVDTGADPKRSTYRIDAAEADAWRRNRGPRVDRPKTSRVVDDTEVDDVVRLGGFRSIAGARR